MWGAGLGDRVVPVAAPLPSEQKQGGRDAWGMTPRPHTSHMLPTHSPHAAHTLPTPCPHPAHTLHTPCTHPVLQQHGKRRRRGRRLHDGGGEEEIKTPLSGIIVPMGASGTATPTVHR